MPESLKGIRLQIRLSWSGKRFRAIRYSHGFREKMLAHVRSEMVDGRKLRDVA
jgi:hypothetical protein